MDRLLEVLREEIGIEDDEAGDVLQYPDTSETVNVSSLALMKMLKHCREGIPIEVMGLLVGTFLDDYTIDVIDVFAMPQKGTTITVESIDPCYQTEMLEMLKVAGRCEGIVGWYHSHPGFGCWLSSIDINTQQSFESLHPRAIAIVLDPVQSVKGKVNLEAFRLIDSSKINSLQLAPTSSARECTSNIGCLQNSESAIHDVGNK